ncbi:MAG: PIN/TRAM domain-containing protein, partial [Romboutsia sp.]
MIRKVARIAIGILGLILGVTTYITLMGKFPGLKFGSNSYGFIIAGVVGIVLGLLFYAVEPWIINKVKEAAKIMDKEISKYPQTDILLGSIGLIVGFVIAYLISGLINPIPIVGPLISLLTYVFMGYLGIRIALKSKDDLFNLNKIGKLSSSMKEKGNKKEIKGIPPKVLDTSVIIDGRIADICKTGFVEGKL